MLQGQLETYED